MIRYIDILYRSDVLDGGMQEGKERRGNKNFQQAEADA